VTCRVALAGLGRIAHAYEDDPLIAAGMRYPTHLSVLREHPGFSLVAACDPNSEARKSFAAKPGADVPVHADCADMLKASRPDLLVIAASAVAHSPLLRLAASHGVPAVFCEKPLAPSLEEALRMERLAQSCGMLLAVNYLRAFGKKYQELAERTAGGEFGELLCVTGSYCRGVFNNGSHLLDLLARLCGPPQVLAGLAGRDFDPASPDPALDMILRFPEGALGHIRGLGGTYGGLKLDVFEAELFFSRARLAIREDQALVWRAKPSRRMRGFLEMRRREERIGLDVGHALHDAYDDLLGCLASGRPPACGAPEALLPLSLINQALAGAPSSRDGHGVRL
jgi:predicted dehydrogenase